jgi:hypothetical protein
LASRCHPSNGRYRARLRGQPLPSGAVPGVKVDARFISEVGHDARMRAATLSRLLDLGQHCSKRRFAWQKPIKNLCDLLIPGEQRVVAFDPPRVVAW